MNAPSWNGTKSDIYTWSKFPMISSFSGNGFSISNLSSLQVSSINGAVFPQTNNTSDWSRFPMISSFSGNGFSISNLSSLQVSSINGASFPQVIPPDNTSKWSQYPALQNVAMGGFNLNNANNGNFNNQVKVGTVFQTIINGGDINTRNITVSDSITKQADVNIYGGNLAPGDSCLYVNGGTTLDGGGTIHGITIGTLPVAGINTQRLDVLPTGINITTPTVFSVLGVGAISLNVGGAGNFAVGGALSLAGGAYIEMNASNVRLINTTSGNNNTLINVGVIDGPFQVSTLPLTIKNSGGGGVQIENVSLINNMAYPPAVNIPTQTLIDVQVPGKAGGDAINYIGNYLYRELNTGNPPLNSMFESTTISGMQLDPTNGQIIIPAGTYQVDVFCPVNSVGRHRCRIFDITNNIVLAMGNNGYSDTGSLNGDNSTLSDIIVIPFITIIEIQQQVEANNASTLDSLGLANSFGDDEIYSSVRFVKII